MATSNAGPAPGAPTTPLTRGVPVDRADLARACRSFGSMLWLTAEMDLDGPRLLWALAGNESSFGANTAPRHEPYYHQLAAEGKNAQLVELTKKFGCDAHASFGPWQELLVNCSPTMTPDQFANVRSAAMETAMFINRRILKGEAAKTLEEIAAAYNSGKWQWKALPPGVERYAAECRKHYEAAGQEMPTAAV